MSYFLCLATDLPHAKLETLAPGLELEGAAGTPIGKHAAGCRPERTTVFCYRGMYSHELLDKGHRDRRNSPLFTRFVAALLEEAHSVIVLVHWMTGMVTEEEIPLRGEERLTVHEFCNRFPEIQEDVRYTIVRSSN